MNTPLRDRSVVRLATPSVPKSPLGRQLVDADVISQPDLVHALELQAKIDAPLGDILIAEGMANPDQVLDAVARQFGARRINLGDYPPDPKALEQVTGEFCMRHQVIPWTMFGDSMVLATSRPDRFDAVRSEMAEALGDTLGSPWEQAIPVIAPTSQILQQVAKQYAKPLAHIAETRVGPDESCRNWGQHATRRLIIAGLGLILAALAIAASPVWSLMIMVAISACTLTLSTGMKIAAFLAQVFAKTPDSGVRPDPLAAPFRLPRVSILVPLLREKEIAEALIARLSRLTYPKALLDVVLVLEEGDELTRDTIARTTLPPWMQVIEVPATNGLTTKPRAMNYALDFCHGSIIGVWDAEDEPDPDQIERVALHFHNAPDDVACLQGILDYYNPRTNWLSRCFTIEYAAWWRIILPGISRLGMIIPLGGTTLFFKRDVLVELGGWDAHNVTEDADLGVRLARHGHRTELITTVTHEEANCRPWRWIRQRSRWLKGYMITYLVHMRSPRQLLRQIGWRKFLGLQVFFISTLSQFVLAPILLSFVLILFGVAHPVTPIIGSAGVWSLAGLFLLAEIVNITVGLMAVSGPKHRHLMKWVPTMMLYFPIGAIASYKAMYELIARPFFWDKTQHGHAQPNAPISAAPAEHPHPGADGS